MFNRLKTNKFLLSTFILLIGGLTSKALGFFLKTYITHALGTYGIGLYSLLSPTYSLLVVISIFSMPTCISRLISLSKIPTKKIMFSSSVFSCLVNTTLIIIICMLSKYIAIYLLKEPLLEFPLICASFVLPFIGLSSVVKGFFWGKQRMFPYVLSNIVEQIVRMILLITIIPIYINKNLVLTIGLILLTNIISEISSIIVMLLFIKRKDIITRDDLRIDKKVFTDIISLSSYLTGSKILGSIAYFFEPIVLINTLLLMGYTKNYIILEYGIINGYVMPVLLLPSFLTQSMSTSLIPEISSLISKRKYELCKKRIKQITLLSVSIGIISTIIIILFSKNILNMLFDTNLGMNYIHILCPFTILYFVELPLGSALESFGKAKTEMYITIVVSVIRLISIFIFSLLKIGLYGLIISIIINLVLTTSLELYYVKKEFNNFS